MQLFRSEDPKLDEFIRSNKHFSLESIHGINGQRRPLSKDFMEALDEARSIEISNYIKSFKIKDGELGSLLSENNKSIDSTQKGWLRKSLSEAIESNDFPLDIKRHLQIGLIATKPRTDISKGLFDFKENIKDPIAKLVFDIKSGAIHHQAVSIIVNELNLIAKEPDDVEGRAVNPKTERINSLIKLTGAKDLQEVFEVMTFVCDMEVVDDHGELGLGSDNTMNDMAVKQIESISNALLGFPEIKQAIDNKEFTSDLATAFKNKDKEFVFPKIAKGSLETTESVLGGITVNDQNNLNYQNNVDYAAESKRLIQAMGVSIDTEHSRFGVASRFTENVGGKAFIESKVQSKNPPSILSKIKKFMSSDDDLPSQEVNQNKVDWTDSDYSWHSKDSHFDTENEKPIKKVSFKDKTGKPMFVHKVGSAFSNNGGMILFAKGREINADEAKLMVSQFMRTCQTGSMFITPPKHLGSKEKTSNHVRLLIEAAVELGVDLNSIHVRPNDMISASDIDRMKAEIGIDLDAQPMNEFGGLSDTALQINNDNELENVVSVNNDAVVEGNKAEQPSDKPQETAAPTSEPTELKTDKVVRDNFRSRMKNRNK